MVYSHSSFPPNLPSLDNEQFTFFLYGFSCSKYHINRIKNVCSFITGFFHLAYYFQGSPMLLACVTLFFANILYGYLPPLIYPFTSRWTFGLFLFFAIVNNTSVNIFCVCASFYMDICFTFSWLYILEWNWWVIW